MGFQFIHVETYARKADSKGRSVDFVFDEASRKPGASEHVENPGAPRLVYGMSIDEVSALHDRRVAEASTTNAAGKTKRLRVDQHTLLTAIASHPATMDEVKLNPETAAEVERWKDRTVEWLRRKYGDQLKTVIMHEDESHPHLHAYVVPDNHEVKARKLHDGVASKDEAKSKALAEGRDAKVANKLGDDAYKAAMRRLQDGYFEQVGLPSGLARLGPGRRRLDRGAWRIEQAQVQHAAVAIAAAEKAEAEAARSTGVRLSQENMTELLVEKAKRDVAAARRAAERAKAEADAAEVRRVEAERAARSYVAKAKKAASQILADAEVRVAKVTTWGERLGRLWGGFTGVKRRAEAQAAKRIAEIEARAAEQVAEVKKQAISKVKTAEARAERGLQAKLGRGNDAIAENTKLKLELMREQAARQAAEAEKMAEIREKERFRAAWAQADNRAQDLGRRRGYQP